MPGFKSNLIGQPKPFRTLKPLTSIVTSETTVTLNAIPFTISLKFQKAGSTSVFPGTRKFFVTSGLTFSGANKTSEIADIVLTPSWSIVTTFEPLLSIPFRIFEHTSTKLSFRIRNLKS